MSAVKHRPLHRKPTITLYMPGSPHNAVEVPRDFAMVDPRAPWTSPNRNPRVEAEQLKRDAVRVMRLGRLTKPKAAANA